MTIFSNSEGRRNKNFMINNAPILKEYALINQENLATEIILINLSLVENHFLKVTILNYEIIFASQKDRQSLLKHSIF